MFLPRGGEQTQRGWMGRSQLRKSDILPKHERQFSRTLQTTASLKQTNWQVERVQG